MSLLSNGSNEEVDTVPPIERFKQINGAAEFARSGSPSVFSLWLKIVTYIPNPGRRCRELFLCP